MHQNSIICRIQLLLSVCIAALTMHPAQSAAQGLVVTLGPSAQTYTLTGTATNDSQNQATYYNTQGACVTSGSTTTCDLTGPFTSVTPGFASGTYDFRTVFTGSLTTAVLSASAYSAGVSSPANNYFVYTGYDPSTTMTLILKVAGGGTYSIPMESSQQIVAGVQQIYFAFPVSSCGGTSLGNYPCQEDYVGLVAGATLYGPVTGLIAVNLPAAPVFTPAAGTFSSVTTVSISESTPGATVYYTTDGSQPTTNSPVYTAPLTVSSSETIQAIAIENDGLASPVSSAMYTIALGATTTATPTFSPSGGSFSAAQTVTISDATAGATIYYTTDGSTPTNLSRVYSGPIRVSSSETLSAIAVAPGDTASPAATASYSIDTTVVGESGQWVWIGGPDSFGPNGGNAGVYGTLGSPAASDQPGGRSYSISWTDSAGNFWLFGGTGYDAQGNLGLLDDLWEYGLTTNQWTWQSGNNQSGAAGVYDSVGTASSTAAPSGRSSSASWVDNAGNLWLYGGLGIDSLNAFAPLDDLWEYSVSSHEWTWVSGSNAAYGVTFFGQPGVYGTLGVAAPTNMPSGRYSAVTWTDASGNLWLFGGYGAAGYNFDGALNDIWEYNPTANEWTWQGGANAVAAIGGNPGIYGTLGQPATGNLPGGRLTAAAWVDSAGNFWLFGGRGFDSTNTGGLYLNDLWKYNPSTKEWTWMAGSSTGNQIGVYGTLGAPSSTNTPGARSGSFTWTDKNGKFWLLGGDGNDSNGKIGYFNDIWMYDPTTNQWTWEGGGQTTTGSGALPGNYGTLGMPAAGNLPGGRDLGANWVDTAGNLWLFGGGGVNSADIYGTLNDLWEYKFSASTSAIAPTVTVAPASNIVTPTTALSVQITVGGGKATPTGSIVLTSGSYTSASTTLSNGSAAITIPANTLAAGTDTLTVTYTPDADSDAIYTSATGTATVTVSAPATAVAPTVTVMPASSSITTSQTLAVTVAVSGTAACVNAQPRLSLMRPRLCGTNTPGTGSIVLSSGSYTSSATTLNNGSATITIPAGALATGTDTLTATYTPDTNSASVFTSATGTNTVTVTTPAATPAVTVTPASSSVTTAQTLSVVISVAGGGNCVPSQQGSSVAHPKACQESTPGTGSVVLSSGSYASAAITLNNGSATVTIPAGALATGTDTLTATYTPDANSSSIFTPAIGTATVTVTPAVVTAPVAALSPTSLTFTAVTGSTSAAQTTTLSNTGNATLSITGITITGTDASSFAETNTCGSSVAANSSCTIAITFTPASAASLTATLTVADNAAAPQALTLNGTGTTPPTFTLASGTPSGSITPTTPTATYQLVVTPQNGSFTSPVSFAVSGLPSGYTASFSPYIVTPNSSAANTTMSIQAGDAVTAMLQLGSVPTLAVLGILLWPGRRRRRIYLCFFAFCSIAASAALSGCGGGFNFITASRTYTLTVIATGAAETQTTTVQLTVQQ
jgi:N-acetylneuraminic acid mutarotase